MTGKTALTPEATSTRLREETGTVKSIQFDNNGTTMAGNLYQPSDFEPGRTYPAIVSVHPGGGVKEQTAGEYAQRLADHGFVTLAFDASHQGASGGCRGSWTTR